MPPTVLVTGISGYLGLPAASQILSQGDTVRGTVRSRGKEVEVRDTMATVAVDTAHLEFVELDLASDAGWEQAATGCTCVLHVASPFSVARPNMS